MKPFALFTLCFLVSGFAIADPITPERAAQLATQFIKDKTVAPQLVKSATRKRISARISKEAEKCAPYYIYSRGDNQGFVIVSGDDALPEVWGYTESGDFVENNMPPFLAWYLDYYASAVESAQTVNAPRMTPSVAASGRVDVAPLLATHWHQTSPYNDKCPLLKSGGRAVTGCVATAASQVLYYWHKDLTNVTLAATGSYTYGDQAYATTAFPKGTQIKWDLMRTQYSNEPAEYKDAVATLLAVVGGGASLTYGSSTAGHNDNCRSVFSNVFGMNGGTENNKDWGEAYNNYSDDAWSTLLYNELIKSRPVLYSGCNSDGDGHAVVVDGYQASTGYFHFNLGWGNPQQWDGYFTVARGKSPSWQGYNASYQECVTGVYPKKQNLSVTLELQSNFYYNRNNDVRIEVKNKGTLDYSGIYVFVNTNGAAPTKLSDAKASDTELVLLNDGTPQTFMLPVKPTTLGRCFVIVTDASLNVLAKVETESILPDSDLYLNSLSISSSTDSEEHNGQSYSIIYNSKATAIASFIDKSGCGYEGSPRLAIYESLDDGVSFNYVGYKSSKLSMSANGEANISFSITSTTSCPLSVGNLYYAVLVNPISNVKSNDPINLTLASDTIVRFILKGADMAFESFEDGVLKLSGTWDLNAFTTLAKKSAYKTATAYDLTSVAKIDEVPVMDNFPNALFYVSDNSEAKGQNVVKGDVCQNLVLTVGYAFCPKSEITATNAKVQLNQEPCKWYLFTAPCDLDVPVGVIARQIDSHTSSGISSKTTDVNKLNAGQTYLVMISNSNRNILTATNSRVAVTPGGNPDDAVIGTFVAANTPAGAMLINNADPQYFDVVTEGTSVEPMRGYFYASNVKKSFRAYSQLASDPTYLTLAKNIDAACKVLAEYAQYADKARLDSLVALVDSAEHVFAVRTNPTDVARSLYMALATAVEQFCQDTYNPKWEKDCTSLIVNPSFEFGTTKGWTTTGRAVKADNLTYKSVDSDGTYLLYCCNSDSTSDELSQTVTGLRAGRYRLSVMVGTSDGHSVTIFAGDTTYTQGAHQLGVHYFSKAVLDDIVVDDSGELTIGIKAGFFYKADDFRLVLLEAAADNHLSEDVNGDDTVDTQDVLNIYDFIQSPSADKLNIFDVNADGMVDTQDVLRVYEYIQNN